MHEAREHGSGTSRYKTANFNQPDTSYVQLYNLLVIVAVILFVSAQEQTNVM